MKEVIANNKIKAQSVRLVDNGTNTVVSITEALRVADNAGFDLVQINDDVVPVVKLMDLNKYLYEMKQSDKENKKKSRASAVQVKEVQFSYGTQEHDLNVKTKNIQRFVSDGKQVRVVMKIDGRKSNHEIVRLNMQRFTDYINTLGVELSQEPTISGNNIVCVIIRKK